jgi:Tol biopolymer transport system component
LTHSDAWTQAQIQVVEADGSGWRDLYPQQRMAHNDWAAAWLPDGNQVDFLTFRYTTNAVFTVPTIGGPAIGLFVRANENVSAFASSPNGNEVALVTRGPDQRGQQFDYRTILRLLERGSGVEFATPNIDRLDSMGEFELVWSPQGDRIAFPATQLHGRRELWVWFRDCPTDLDRCLVPLTDLGGVNGRPTWSPDGRWLAFASGTAAAFDIYAVNVPEYWSPNIGPEAAMHLASSEGWDFALAWRP